MTKFKIGDKVRILDVDSINYGHKYWRNGDITEVDDFLGVHPSLRRTVGLQYGANGDSLHVTPEELHAIELVETPDEIEELKRKVSELEAKVKRLESERFTVSPSIITKPSPNAERKQAIEKAKKFVAKIQSESNNGRNKEGGNRTYRILTTKSEFIVNEKKRTIVALVRGTNSGKLLEKGIAKCAPTDVFNERIGKAIALGRAYGLDVSEFEQAPQPDEVVYGMVVRGNGEGTSFYRRDRPFTIDGKNGDDGFYYEESKLYSGGKYDYILRNQIGDIISDTEAKY